MAENTFMSKYKIQNKDDYIVYTYRIVYLLSILEGQNKNKIFDL